MMKSPQRQRHRTVEPTITSAAAAAGRVPAPEDSPRQRGQRDQIAQLMTSVASESPAVIQDANVVQFSRTAEKRLARQKANQSRRAERRERIQAERESTRAERSRRKRRPRRLEGVLPEISASQRERYDLLAVDDETSWGVRGKGLLLAREGQQGPFDEDFGEDGTLMWRSDTRSPKAVLQTGFTTKAERDLGPAAMTEDGGPTGNEIVYRTGTEDIVPATGVCVARDVRGACFFPFEGAEHDSEMQEEAAYLYGVRIRQATNTFKAQKVAERHATGRQDWKDPSRFAYDPNDEHTDEASAVWPFAEYVTHRIVPEDIVAAYRFKRDRLVAPDRPRVEPKAGIGFSITPHNLVKPDAKRRPIDPLREAADLTAEAYRERYPHHPDHYLSYQGTVRKLGKGHPQTDKEAAGSACQIDALPAARPRPDLKKAARRRKLAEKKERKQRGKPNPKASLGRANAAR